MKGKIGWGNFKHTAAVQEERRGEGGGGGGMKLKEKSGGRILNTLRRSERPPLIKWPRGATLLVAPAVKQA